MDEEQSAPITSLSLLSSCHLSLPSTLSLYFSEGKIDGEREGEGEMIEIKSKICGESEVALSTVCVCVCVCNVHLRTCTTVDLGVVSEPTGDILLVHFGSCFKTFCLSYFHFDLRGLVGM